MGCHIIDAAFWALELREPRSIEAESPPISPHPETAPAWSIVRYDFEARGSRPPVKLLWYDGGKLPPLELFDGHAPANDSSGSLFVGEKGRLVQSQGRRGYRLLPERELAGYAEPKPTLARSPGHHAEWIEACKTGKPTGTNFDYSARLTELVLLGNVALRDGRRIDWDAAGMRITNELRLPLESVRMVMGDTDHVPFDMGTFGSRTTPTMVPQMRRAAAAARALLLGLAAEKWGVDRGSLETAGGRVTHSATGRTLGFGELTRGRKLLETIGERTRGPCRPRNGKSPASRCRKSMAARS